MREVDDPHRLSVGARKPMPVPISLPAESRICHSPLPREFSEPVCLVLPLQLVLVG